ncbi:MAG TPA: PRTRC system protein E [Candidatus Angelobacter sp.]|nr:PRTRC system protein E [Candidatus Angelobacter sp.]
MFRELMPLIQRRPLTITVAALDDKQIAVNVVPKPLEKNKAANGSIKYNHKKEVAEIPEVAIHALTTPLSITGTPEEIDAQLVKTLSDFTALHQGLQSSYDAAASAIQEAVRAIDERDKQKKDADKGARKSAAAKPEEKKRPAEPELPSLFTAPGAVSANDDPLPSGNSAASAQNDSQPQKEEGEQQ